MNTDTKICPYCAETIRSLAKVCPRCRQWMTLRSLNHPAYQTIIWVLPALVTLFALAWILFAKLEKQLYPRPFYTEAPDSLRVLESKMVFRTSDRGPSLYLIGTITNESAIAWENAEFECRFYDSNKMMIDVAHRTASMTIQPNDEAAFSFSVKPTLATNTYSSFQLRVVTARSAESIY